MQDKISSRSLQETNSQKFLTREKGQGEEESLTLKRKTSTSVDQKNIIGVKIDECIYLS